MRTTPFAVALAGLALAAPAAAAPNAAPAAAPEASAARERLADFFLRTKGITRLVPASRIWESVRAGKDEYVVVDVRPPQEFAKGHVPGAINLPIDVLFRPASLARLPPPGGKPLVLVCQSGHTESMALGGLAALGFEPWVMKFGMIGWSAETQVKAGGPAQQQADVVHGVGGAVEEGAPERG
jgi:rhodanese-related sulfurtransferase